MTTRRDFVRKTARAGLGAATLAAIPAACAQPGAGAPSIHTASVRPTAIASANGVAAVAEAMRVLRSGGDTLDAVVRGVNLVELDPNDVSVGYGGLPNADGVVQLDASVMHGPSRGAGAVAALEGVRTPSRVAVAVMRHTDHVMLVGQGAREFAQRMGFRTDEELLTEASRRRWLEYRAGEIGSNDTPANAEPASGPNDDARPWGTIHCAAIDAHGNLSAVTTTSGLAFKLPGRVGDSPIIGAGLYVDNDVGAAGSTGRGESVIKIVGAAAIVEAMRGGASPTDACLAACRRIVDWTVEPHLLGPDGRPAFDVAFYALDRRGRYGAASLWSGAHHAVNVDGVPSIGDNAWLFERS